MDYKEALEVFKPSVETAAILKGSDTFELIQIIVSRCAIEDLPDGQTQESGMDAVVELSKILVKETGLTPSEVAGAVTHFRAFLNTPGIAEVIAD
ncbi:MAG: hypothetical protein KAS32_25280 [Candidatus Peribacteraceae bacterium]|nr:hypothetical protein [Candidatus Peribacteraceae bacterium]